jgi:hypothetical protein
VRLEAARWLEGQGELNLTVQAILLDALRRAQVWDNARIVGETLKTQTPADVMILRGPAAYVRPDNGPEFIALALVCTP